MAASEALTQEVVASIVFNCQNLNEAVRRDAIKADAVGGTDDPNAQLATVAVFCKVAASFTNEVIKDADESNQADMAANCPMQDGALRLDCRNPAVRRGARATQKRP